jgi:ribosomal protein L31
MSFENEHAKKRRCVVAWTSGGDEKNVDAWLRGRVEAMKKRRCVVAWTRRGDEKNVDAWLRGRVEAIKKRWSFGGKRKRVIRWEKAKMRGGVDEWRR